MKKFLMVVAVIIGELYTHTATAITDTTGIVERTCPSGMFCTSNGKYHINSHTVGDLFLGTTTLYDDIPTYMYGPAELVTPGWGAMMSEQFCSVCNGDDTCAYCADEYDEVWVSTWFGFYGAKNNDVTNHSWRNTLFAGVFPCPGTYPSSDSGASSVFQCYRTTSNGQKEYYKTPNKTTNNYDGNYNTADVNALLTNLQSAIDQANSASQNLQAILKKSNNKIKVTSVTGIKQKLNSVAANVDQTNVASIQTTQPGGNTSTTNNASNTNNTPTQTTDNKTTATTTTKKLNFGDLSSVFTSAKVAKPVPTRSATERQKSTSARTTATPTTTRVRDNAAAARPTQTKERASATRHQQR